jgi:hypothetical protein
MRSPIPKIHRTQKSRKAEHSTTKKKNSRLQMKIPTVQAPPKASDKSPAKRTANKSETIVALLRRPNGASIAELCKATGWQAHSVRGAISGTIKKKLGLKVISTKSDGARTYRITK